MEVDNNEESSENENEKEAKLLDASDPTVAEKYKNAGIVANRVLHTILKKCSVGTKIVDLCRFGDNLIEEECQKRYPELKVKGQKGIAFPTCISPNEICGHYSPFSDDNRVLQHGDVVKIDLGVHFDGFVAVVAHTIVLGECKDRKADVIAATWSAAQAALRLLKPKNKNSQVTLAISKSSETFKCEPMDSVLSHEMRQYVIDHENTIISKETQERKVAEFEFKPFQVFGIDIMMSTGRGKAIDRGEKCTIFKRNVEIETQLKMKTSRELLGNINKQYPTFPFTMRNFEDNRAKLGIGECRKANLVQAYPILSEKQGEFVAQFKYTVIITANGALQLSGLLLDMSTVFPNHQITDNKLKLLLAQDQGIILPSFYEKVDSPLIEKK